MKPFFAFIKKEIYHIFRDKRTLLILFGMPIVQVILFGFAITNEIVDAKITILDQSHDEVTEEITQKLLSSGYFILDKEIYDESAIEKRFQQGKTKMAVVFQPDFKKNFFRGDKTQVQLIADASDPNTAATLVLFATSIIKDYQFEKLKITNIPFHITIDSKMLYNPLLKSVFLFVPGIMTIILMLVSAMMTSIAITKEKELGTMEVLLVSPLRPATIVAGKVLPYVLLALINAITILLLGTYVFGMPVRGSLVLLMAEMILFIITSLSLGILISTKTQTQQVALMLSLLGLMLPTILLSGFIFPIENMPKPLQFLSHIIPAKWFVIILKNIMLKGVGIRFIWKETLILAGMTVVLIGLSIKNFKIRLE